MHRIYLDHNASAPLLPQALDAMRRHLEGPPANPSSVHAFGHAGRMAVEAARRSVADLVGARPGEVVFTSGGTEANNLAVFGAAGARPPAAGRRVVVTAIEHPSVLGPAAVLEEDGYDVVRVRPDRRGVVSAEEVAGAAGPGTVLVAVMLANNETGALQPVAEIGRAIRGRGIHLHCDAAQAAGRVPVDAAALGVDTLALAAHKFGGPPGAGALLVRGGLALRPHLRGGGQELNRRPGTENVPAIAGMGAAAVAAAGALYGAAAIAARRDRMEAAVLARVPNARVNAAGAPRVPNTSSLAFDGVAGEILVAALDLEGVAVSAGAACSAGSVKRSHVLEAMGLAADAAASIRVSLGPATTDAETDAFVDILARVVARARESAAVPAGGRA